MRLDAVKAGQRVTVFDAYKRPEHAGRVVGSCHVDAFDDRPAQVSVAVALDRGFYCEGKTTFVSVLLVHPDHLELEMAR